METLPEKPSEQDCCGSGCSPCVFDVYEKLLENLGSGTSDQSLTNNLVFRHDLLSPLKYKPFTLISVEKVSRNSNCYCFRPFLSEKKNCSKDDPSKISSFFSEEINGILPYIPGQHIIMVKAVKKIENKLSVSRAYTPISVAKMQKNCALQLLIKLYENGIMFSFINQLAINDVVFFRGPFGDFRHVRHSKYLMICAGTGFAPMIPIIETVLSDDCDETLMRLCFACSTFKDVYFREKIRHFTRYWNFEAHIYLSNESDEQISEHIAYNENIYSQKITVDALKMRIFSVEHKVLICGSDSFNRDVENFVRSCGCDDIFIF